ncbi:hypothetical protein [Falsiroseomonas sp. CW058]|uniref:hypothetical protein n=1 Tax=Falsiroseomonas sp. CW058 TaxID=3388664 RepID=UPI003D32372B
MGRHGWLGALALPLALAGCGVGDLLTARPTGPSTAPCPRIAILGEGADLTRFRDGAGRDLTAMEVDAVIAGFDARCDHAGRDRRVLDVRVAPRFRAERGPAFGGRAVDLPWFVALSDANDSAVLERIPATTRITFPPDIPGAAATGQAVRLAIPVAEGLRASDYVVRLSFQLTPEELAHNRQRGPR